MAASGLKQTILRVQASIPYTAGIILLCLIAVVLVALELLQGEALSPEFHQRSLQADFAISLVFLADYLIAFWASPRKLAYVFSIQGFFSLISSIPLTANAYRVLRIARLIRLVRVFQAATEGQQVIARRNGLVGTSDRMDA